MSAILSFFHPSFRFGQYPMIITITVCILGIAVGAVFVWYACRRAPEGYEDRVGFRKHLEEE